MSSFKTFKQKQAEYSKKMHAAIDSVGTERWRAIRDTAIEFVAGIAALVSLAGELASHVRFLRGMAAMARG